MESFRESIPLEIVVIGGGLAGMSAAEALARCFGDRVRITILEARRVTGGRAGSFADPAREETVDYCQHVAMGCCTNFRQLLNRCGLDQLLCRHRTLTFVHPQSSPSQFSASTWLPAPLHLAGVIGAMTFLDRRQRWQVRRGMMRLLRARDRDLRGNPAGAWLRAQGQDDDTIGEFWGTFAVSALGEEIERVDMSAVRKVMVDGFAAARGASDVLVPTIPLSELFGVRLPQQLEQLGITIRTGVSVAELEHRSGKVMLQTSSKEVIEADHVVCAVPWHGVERLFTDAQVPASVRRAAEIPSSAITGVHLWLDREITPLPLVVLVGTVAQWVFRPPWLGAGSERDGHYYQVVISASNKWRSLPKESLIEIVMSDLQHVSEEAKRAQLLHSRVVTDPHSVFSLRPDVLSLRPSSRTALPWFHLAGDWTETGWPATMEGAVISGRLAAGSISSREGWGPVDVDPGLRRGLVAKALIRAS